MHLPHKHGARGEENTNDYKQQFLSFVENVENQNLFRGFHRHKMFDKILRHWHTCTRTHTQL